MRLYVEVTISTPGTHYWTQAPKPVGFLGQRHRHTFRMRVRVAASHPDRSVEFLTLRADIEALLRWTTATLPRPRSAIGGFDFAGQSCEQIAEELYGRLVALKYDVMEVGVSEDGEFEGGVLA